MFFKLNHNITLNTDHICRMEIIQRSRNNRFEEFGGDEELPDAYQVVFHLSNGDRLATKHRDSKDCCRFIMREVSRLAEEGTCSLAQLCIKLGLADKEES